MGFNLLLSLVEREPVGSGLWEIHLNVFAEMAHRVHDVNFGVFLLRREFEGCFECDVCRVREIGTHDDAINRVRHEIFLSRWTAEFPSEKRTGRKRDR
jgi:hypothetical protein